MKSLAPRDYESLPALAAPAGYICVIRDIDRDRYRIEATRSPRVLIDAVVAEEQRSFGIELLSVLQTEDLAASEAELYARHHARLSSDWLELDSLQLEELRLSALLIDAQASLYLTTDYLSSATGGAALAAESRNRPRRASEAARRSDRRAGGVPARRPLASYSYGARALEQRRRSRQSNQSGGAISFTSARQAITNWIDDQLTQNPIVVFAIIVTAALICFGMIRDRGFLWRGNERPVPVTVETPTAFVEPPAARPTPAGKPYLITQTAPVYRCAAISCRRPVLLSKRTQIWALNAVAGPPVNGSSVWIEFQLYGDAAFLPISYLEPLG